MADKAVQILIALALVGVWGLSWGRFRRSGGELTERPSFADIPWSLSDLALFALTFIAFSTTAAFVFVGADEMSLREQDRQAWTVAASFGAQVVGALSVLLLLVCLRRVNRSHFGWVREKVGTKVLFGLSAYIVFVPVVLLAMIASNKLLQLLGHEFVPQEVVTVLLEKVRPGEDRPRDLSLIVVFVVSTVVLIPICEEFLFRGLLLGGLRRFLPPVPAILLSSYMFALAHTVSTLIPIFALAVIMGAVYDRTRSLPATIAIHAAHNGLMVMGAFLSA